MPKILGLDMSGQWHDADVASAGRMTTKCDGKLVRAVAYAREDSSIIKLKDVCPRCRETLLVIPQVNNAG